MSNPNHMVPPSTVLSPRLCDYALCVRGCVFMGGCPTPTSREADLVEPKPITRGEISREIVTITEGTPANDRSRT